MLSSLTAETDRLVLNVQLVEARSRRLLWSRDFEGRRDGYLALARGAAEELRARAAAGGPVIAQARTSNSEAELAYQRGMHHFNRYNNQHEKADFDQGLAAVRAGADAGPADGGRRRRHRVAARVRDRGRHAGRAGAAGSADGGSARSIWTIATAARGRSWRCGADLDTPSRHRDALIAALRALGAARRVRRQRHRRSRSGGRRRCRSRACEEAARLDPLYLYPPLNASESLSYLNRPEEALAYAENVLGSSRTCRSL